jgi:uroporphyrinogen decarboxylase
MNSKQRFIETCKFGKPDRLCIDYMAHPETDKRLRKYFNCETEDELLDRLDCDFYYLPSRDISQNEGFMPCYKGHALKITEEQRVCPLGITWSRGAYDSKFVVDEAVEGPLENADSEKDILCHPWPCGKDFDFSILEKNCDLHKDKIIIGGLWTGIMGDSYRLFGFENFLLNTALKPNLVKCLIDRITDMYLELNEKCFSQLKNKIDIWFFGNDFGSQDGLLLGPDMWYEFFFENIKKLVTLAHSYGVKVMMHSCGGIADIIPFLIEAGVDILDPIQVTAKGMEPELLAEKFGGRIVFHGGVDTQQVLPYGTIKEVRVHSKYVAKELSQKGGYIFTASQILGPDIPIENIAAMYGTVNSSIETNLSQVE